MRYLLHDVFTKNIPTYSNKTAIQHEFGETFSYQELNNLTNHIYQLIQRVKPKNISQAPFIGILSHVNAFSIASILATLKIGAAYVPLDDQSPVNRLQKIIENLKLDIIIIDEAFLDAFSPLLDNNHLTAVLIISEKATLASTGNKKNIIIDVNKAKTIDSPEPPQFNQVSDDLAYILHSSGSTGVPKGIMLTHRNARTFVDWMQKEFKLCENDVVMARAPLKFDLSVFDIFNTLNAGATLVCYDWRKRREGIQKHVDYVSLLESCKATFLYTTPSTFIALLNHGKLGNQSNHLHTIMYAGEPFPLPQLKRLQQALPQTNIANIYGPTETNIITYYWIKTIEQYTQAIPLGKAVDDTEIMVVNPNTLQLCADNEIGELWCRGGTVTLGYLGNEQKTQEHLVQSPFHPFPAKFWRTGDYGYRDEKGCLYYRGRKDHMVKIKGYRIELGEVEAAIADIDSLDEFCVVAIKATQTTKLFCIYSTKLKKAINESLFINHLAKKLPQHMIPSHFHFQSELPKTSSGKIDRVLLTNTFLEGTHQ